MVDVAQSVEHQIVVLGVAGSSPVIHPIIMLSLQKNNLSGCSAVGSALALGARGRRFESDHPDQFSPP